MGDAAFAADGGAGGDAHQRRGRLHQFGAEWQPAIAGHHDFQQVAGTLLPNQPGSQVENQAGSQSAERGHQQPFGGGEHFGHLHRVAGLRQESALHHFPGPEEEQIDQPAQHAHHAGHQQMSGFLLEDQFLAPTQGTLPMAAKKYPRLAEEVAVHPRLHKAI